MKDYQTISLNYDDGIALLRLNRPDKMNALSTQMRAEITHAAHEAGRTARVLVITGEGRAFCSGQDLSDSGDVSAMDLERVLRDEYEPMLHAIGECPIPTISATDITAPAILITPPRDPTPRNCPAPISGANSTSAMSASLPCPR